MKKTTLTLFLLLTTITIASQNNRAIKLDGLNSNMAIGMQPIHDSWTIEMWIKGNDTTWKDCEVLIGGGEYSDINTLDKFPLILKNGHLHNNHSGLQSPMPLDDRWHHVAATCGKHGTTLYVDGRIVAKSNAVSSITPGVIGADEKSETVFDGLIDEVRIWETELSGNEIKRWMNIPINSKHPQFKKLKGYYPFDENTDDYYINWTGIGPLSYHVRNYRINYKQAAPLTPTVESNNDKFNSSKNSRAIFNAIEIPSEWDVIRGGEEQILKLRIAINGDDNKKMNFSELVLDLTSNTSLSDIENISLYRTGSKAKSKEKTLLAQKTPDKRVVFSTPYELNHGINYFLVTFKISDKAQCGNKIGAKIESFTVNGTKQKSQKSSDFYPQIVIPNKFDENIVKVLQWNIWHGGVHLGSDGPGHIIDLLKQCNADIVTMQEAYGSQDRIAEALNYKLSTKSGKDNLALFTRYKMLPIATRNAFKSNPVIITLPGGRELFVLDTWLRYAYRPEYTCGYRNKGYDPQVWTKEDEEFSTTDIAEIFNDDMEPYIESPKMPIIVGGDFNSGSHLDWTARAAHLHNGYVNTDLPTSQLMLKNGYKDSFREMNPDEVTHSGGTFAVIFGQLQNSRIDFLYYKGEGIKPLYSKTIRTSEEIDFVWAGDHAAVFTIFKIESSSK